MGEKFNSKLEWLSGEESGSEDHQEGSSGSGERVLAGSPSEYFALSRISDSWPIAVKFIRPAQDGFVPDVRGDYRNVRDSLVGPGVPGESSKECVEEPQGGQDHHF